MNIVNCRCDSGSRANIVFNGVVRPLRLWSAGEAGSTLLTMHGTSSIKTTLSRGQRASDDTAEARAKTDNFSYLFVQYLIVCKIKLYWFQVSFEYELNIGVDWLS